MGESMARISGPQKGPVERRHVEKRQKVSNILLETFRHFLCRARKRQKSQGQLLAERIFRGFFIFKPPDTFADLVAGFLSPCFCGQSAQKILHENPLQNPPKSILQTFPTTFCRGARPKNHQKYFPTLFDNFARHSFPAPFGGQRKTKGGTRKLREAENIP